MLIKFQFTALKQVHQIMRVIADIIATSSVTSIATLRTRATAANYDSSLLSLLDDANSYIYRTDNPSNVVSHISGAPGNKIFYLTLQFSIFDNTSSKVYIQFYNNASGVRSCYQNAGTASNASIYSSQMPVTTTDATTAQTGTVLSMTGTTQSGGTVLDATYTGLYTFWFYINNNGCVMAINTNNNNLAGWPASYSSGTLWSGPFLYSQYTRDDYTNGEFANNFTYPLMLPADRGIGVGFGTGGDFTNTVFYQNALTVTANTNRAPFQVFRLVYNPSATDTASPTVYTTQGVALTIDGFSNQNRNVAYENYVTTANANIYRRLVDNANIGYKIPNSIMATPVFGQHDIGWELSYYGCWGGSASQLLGVYLFNGDYSPGDEYTIGSVTYMIWPLWNGYTGRLGLAIPKA